MWVMSLSHALGMFGPSSSLSDVYLYFTSFIRFLVYIQRLESNLVWVNLFKWFTSESRIIKRLQDMFRVSLLLQTLSLSLPTTIGQCRGSRVFPTARSVVVVVCLFTRFCRLTCYNRTKRSLCVSDLLLNCNTGTKNNV